MKCRAVPKRAVQSKAVRRKTLLPEQNRKKCYTMVFSRSRKYDFPPEFSIQGQDILEDKKEATILGVIL